MPRNEDGTPQRHPDPFEGNWSQLQNDGGVNVPGRSNNCADCSRSFLETWYGNPQVSAPRTLDTDVNGNPDVWSPEHDANDNQIRWTGAAHTYAGPGGDPNTANNIASTLQQAGPGSAAIVQVDWPGGGGHAFNVVNHDGKIVWVDTQSGQVSNQPLHIDQAAHVWHIPLDANRNPIDTSQPHAEGSDGSESQNDESQNPNGGDSQPEASENNGEPENSQSPQSEASSDTPKQDDGTETGPDSPKSSAPATPDASNDGDSAHPSTTDPNMLPDPTRGEHEPENDRPQSETNSLSEPDGTPDGKQPSHDVPDTPESRQSPGTPSEQNRPSSAETPSTSNQQAHSDEAAHRDERGHSPDRDSEQPTTTTENPSRLDSSSEQRPPAHTTSDNADNADNADNGTPDHATAPTRAKTDTPNNQEAPQQASTAAGQGRPAAHQQTTVPGGADRHTHAPDRDTPTQKKPETTARPDDRSRPAAETRPDRRTPITPGTPDHRSPNAPAGTNSGADHNAVPQRPRGSAAYDAVQDRNDTHYGMLPEPSQANLRETNDVAQTDLTPVYDRIHEWSNNGELSSLLGNQLADEQGGIRKSTLINALTGFGDLTEGQQGAVVAALARMDLRFHATSAVGTALDPHTDNPNSPANYTPHTTDPEKIERSNTARKVIGQLMDKAGIKSAGVHYHTGKAIPGRAALTEAIHQRISEGEGLTDSEIAEAVQNEIQSLGDHKGDWSRKNFAVIEVRDPENNNEIRYVVDSSLPMSSAWGGGVHSEPHAMEWIKAVNAKREAAGEAPFEPVSLYTEREPCGHASGNDCSGYISDEIEEPKDEDQLQEGEKKNSLRIHYGVGFRRGQIDPDADLSNDDGTTATPEEAKEEARKKFTGDFNNYVNRLKGIWEGNAKAGSMSS
ncbi:toxin glutamine deamidase domain-containing protein [Streptomyces sp. TLI_185]|uniref:toxin glutamine deamidase domain-containing protein n=1 Tax=Streptomyces sp. TLI_185 TaxID=2485151 RepID=UPI00160728DA|nr:toxin glutamine deamidase domain-containing protein [Streptomyces sp. TLI_185]